jgi:hypothetical protein
MLQYSSITTGACSTEEIISRLIKEGVKIMRRKLVAFVLMLSFAAFAVVPTAIHGLPGEPRGHGVDSCEDKGYNNGGTGSANGSENTFCQLLEP